MTCHTNIYIHDDGGLARDSWAMSEGVRAISTQRLRHRITIASDDTPAAIIHKVRLWLD